MSNRVIHFPDQGLPGSVVYVEHGGESEHDDPDGHGDATGPEPAGTPVEVEARGRVEVPAGALLVYAADADGDALAGLAQCPPDAFVVVDVRGATDETVRSVGGLRDLRTLVLSGDFTDDCFEALRGLSSLGDMVVESPRFTGAGLASLAGSDTLDSLDSLIVCDGGAFDPASLRALAGAEALNSLTLENTRVDDALADAVLSLTPTLTDVSLTERPGHALEVAVLERLLRAGLTVNGVFAPPEHAAAFAAAAAEAAAEGEDEDDLGGLPGGDRDERAPAPLRGVLRDLTDEAELNALLAGPTPVLVQLTAPWCGPCHVLTPVVEDVVEACGEGLRGAVVDVDAVEWAQERFDSLSVPTVVLLRDGAEVFRFHGVRSRRQLASWLEVAGVPATGRHRF